MRFDPAQYPDAPRWPFGDSPELADELLALVLAGQKRATCNSLADAKARGLMPKLGEINIVLDGAGQPACSIETTAVDIMRFDAVDAAFAAEEGEGDGSLAFWRDAHQAYFRRQGTFDADMLVVCERFALRDIFERPEPVR
ncbi:ASCH domain-containing protein [Phreatobacter aquaticus]|uniref:ASCH domain-containing protein n=1 Tax=Phreatobacter aquaticus TaxID=2570229 RepID=A0A4D7QED4_9HYPH|nr:ASCH domain-containing protein [Phreatobacter aquaticus]QCK86350.1 ASCH domain-containing protein [Phreatobacter aquaticus]